MAAVFVQFAPFLRAYAPYLSNYEVGIRRKVELASGASTSDGGSGGGRAGGGDGDGDGGSSNSFNDFLDAALRDQRCHGLDLGRWVRY